MFLPVTPSQRNLQPRSCPLPGCWGAEGPHLPASPSPRSVSPGPACPGGLQAAATLVHTRSSAPALCVSSLRDSGHSLCTRVQACVHMPEAPCTRALRAEDRPQRASPGQRPRLTPSTLTLVPTTQKLESMCIRTLHAGDIIIQAKGLLDFTLKVPTVQMTKTPH